MALEKQLVPLNIAVSANQKVDPQSLQPGTPTLVKNVKYQKANRIDKRYGYSTITMTDTDSTAITGCTGIIGTDNNLVLQAGDNLYDYAETLDRWRKRGIYIPCETTIKSINESSEPIYSCDSVYVGGYIYYAYIVETQNQGVRGNIYFLVVDATTNQVVSGPTLVNDPANGTADTPMQGPSVKLLEFNGAPYLFYSEYNSDQIYGRVCGPSYTDYMNTEITLVTDLAGQPPYYLNRISLLNWNDTRIIMAYPTYTDTVQIRYYNSSLTELTGSYALKSLTTMPCDSHVEIAISSGGNKFFVISSKTESNSNVYYAIINSDGTTDTAATSLTINADTTYFGSPSTHVYISAQPHSYNSKNGVLVYMPLDNNPGAIYNLDWSTYTLHLAEDGTLSDRYNGGGTANTDFNNYWDFIPVSKEITFNSRVYQIWQRTVADDSCMYLATIINSRPHIISQILYGRSLDSNAWLPWRRGRRNLNTISTGVFEFCSISKDSSSQVSGIVSLRFDFTNTEELFTGVPYGRSMLIAGTNLHSYDGHYLRELGFFFRPKAPTLTQGAQGSTAIADGTYSVLFVFEYTDRNGLLHRSAPGPATSITVSSGSGQAKITCKISTYSITNLTQTDYTTIPLVKVIPYRTAAGGSIYYREAYFDNVGLTFSIQDPDAYDNDPDLMYLTIDLILPDSSLTTQPVLYTDSGEIPPAPIPPVKYITTWNKRIICGGTARDESIFYSKTAQTNLAPEFTETFSIGIQELAGKTTGIVGFSDKLILAKRGRFYYSYGEGPDSTGQGGDFALFEQILGVSGAVNGKSMAVNKEGLYYKSDKGVFVLNGGLATEHIGAMYEDEADTTIIKTISPLTSETLRMLTGSGIIEHDTFFNTWSLQTGLTPVDAAIYDNNFYLLDNNDDIYKEDRTVFKDGSASYGMYIETGWISLASIIGFQRLYEVFIKATYKSTHTLKVSIAYDFGSYVDNVTLDPADAIDDDVYRFSIYPSTQKCQSFRLKFEEVITDGTAGTHESLQFNFIGVKVGIKKGMPRLKPAQKVGVTAIA